MPKDIGNSKQHWKFGENTVNDRLLENPRILSIYDLDH